MSEPTNAQIAAQEDMRLDAQIAEHEQAKYEQRNEPPNDNAPDPEPPHLWYEDPDEMVAFARWYWKGALNFIGSAGEILDYFEEPWKWTPEYEGYLAEKRERYETSR